MLISINNFNLITFTIDVIYSTIKQLESKVSQIITRCLTLFVVVYKHVMFLESKVMVGNMYNKSRCHHHHR